MTTSNTSTGRNALLEDAVRLAALEATDIRSATRSEALRPVVRLAGRVLDVPVAQINVLTADRQVPVAVYAPEDPERWSVPVTLDASFCQHVVTSGKPLKIEDARKHPLVRDNLGTTHAGIVAYLGVPLYAPASLGPELGGRILGSVCAVDFVPRRWTERDVALLDDLSAAVTAELGIRVDTAVRAARDVADAAAAALERAGAALAESEGRFRTIADSIPQLAWMADEQGVVHWFNQRMLDYTGIPMEELRRGGWLRVQHPAHRDRVIAGFRAAIESRTPWEDTFPLRASDGSYRWFLSRAVPVRDPDAGVVRWFGTNTDISEHIAAEAEREHLLRAEQEARHAAEVASRARTQFLAVMSHELRTPLNAIGGYVDLLDMGLRGPVTDAQREDYARIRRSQQHLLGLINEVLNFAKLESGTVSFETADVSAFDIIHDVAGMIHHQATTKGLRFVVETCDPTLAVRADREKLRQVLVNLTSNALKFTPAPGEVHLACVPEADRVRFVVRDTGIGIPADKLEAVFEPFVQVRPDLTRTAEGTGLGLSISRDLARGMGGDLTVASTVDAGSTFTLTLPRAPDIVAGEAARRVVRRSEAEEAGEVLRREGVHGVLRYLNARTMHRFTGLYRFDGQLLRNVALFDREHPGRQRGEDAPLRETYCSMVGAREQTVAIEDSRTDPRTVDHPAREAVVSYCGALVRGADGAPLGTLCSFDVETRPVPSREIPLLEAVAPLLAEEVLRDARLVRRG